MPTANEYLGGNPVSESEYLGNKDESILDKAVSAVKSFDESQSKGAATGINLDLVGRLGLNPITDKSETITGTDAEKFILNLGTEVPRIAFGLIDQLVANPYEFLSGLGKAPVQAGKTMYEGVAGNPQQREAAAEQINRSPLLPLALAAPIMGGIRAGMTPKPLGLNLSPAEVAAQATESAKVPGMPMADFIAEANKPQPKQLTYQPNMGVLKPRGEITGRAMTPDEWREWVKDSETEGGFPKDATVTYYGKKGKVLQRIPGKRGSIEMPDNTTPQLESTGPTQSLYPNMGISYQGSSVYPHEPKIPSGMSENQVPNLSPRGVGVPPLQPKLPAIEYNRPIALDEIAQRNGAKFDGIQETGKGRQFYQFTDNQTGTTVLVKDPSELSSKLEAKRVEFSKGQSGGQEGTTLYSGIDPNLFKGMGDNLTPTFLKSAESRAKLPQTKELFNEIKTADEIRGTMEGNWITDLDNYGLRKLNRKQSEELGKQLSDGTGGQQYAGLLQRVWQEAKNAGIEIGKVKNYFPRIIKRKVAEKMYDDLRPIIKDLKSGDVSDRAVAKALEKADQKTRNILKYMVDNGQAKGYLDAVKGLYYAAQHDLFKITSFEKHRSLKTELPSWVYETDAREVLPMYVEAMSKRIADAKVWGPNLERAADRITAIRNVDMKEAGMAEQVLKTHTGVFQAEKQLGAAARKTLDRFAAFEYGTKIGFGTSTIPNITQPIISALEEYGYGKGARAGFKLAISPKFRESIRRSGAVNIDMFRAMTGYHPAGAWGKFADFATTGIGFKHINRFNQYLSAAVADVAIRDYWKLAQKEGVRARWAQERLNDIGLDYKRPLTDESLARGMYRVAMDTQLQSNILKEPLWMNDPRWRVFGIMKRFGLKQFKYQKDLLTREVKRGNVMPALRLIVGGYAGGEFVVWAKNKVREIMSGEPQYREEDQWTWQRAINNLAAIGSLGVFSDIAGGTADRGPAKSTVGQVAFAATPLIAQEGYKVKETSAKIAGQADRYGVKTAIRQNVGDILGQISPLLGYAGDLSLNKRQESYRSSYLKSQKKGEILDAIIAKDSDKAKRLVRLWNQHHRNNPLTTDDINADEVSRRITNTKKVQAGVR